MQCQFEFGCLRQCTWSNGLFRKDIALKVSVWCRLIRELLARVQCGCCLCRRCLTPFEGRAATSTKRDLFGFFAAQTDCSFPRSLVDDQIAFLAESCHTALSARLARQFGMGCVHRRLRALWRRTIIVDELRVVPLPKRTEQTPHAGAHRPLLVPPGVSAHYSNRRLVLVRAGLGPLPRVCVA